MKIATMREKIAYCEEQKTYYQCRIDECTTALSANGIIMKNLEISKSTRCLYEQLVKVQ